VVSALGLDASLARSLVRFSLGRDSSDSDVETVSRLLPEVIQRAQRSGKSTKSL
jgi:cysteine desulfurase